MTHDFSLVFDTESPYWQKVLDIFNRNEKYEKKIVSNRNLHHKFPRSFSKKLGETVDNDKDNLISLSLADHFLVHYYYYLLAKKGYRQSMATAFTYMARKSIKYITPETAEYIAQDYEEAKCIAKQVSSEAIKGRIEIKKKMSEAHKGKIPWNKGKKLKPITEEHARKMHEAWKGRHHTAESRKKMSEASKGENNPLFGKHLSNETRIKMSEAAKRRWARNIKAR